MARPTETRPASPRALLTALLASTALVGIGLIPVRAEPLPTGGQVVSGGVTIGSPSHGALAITQSSQNAIVNWQGFSVGRTNRVDIHQPDANAAILNRVTGTTPSTIAGQINANGQVYLVNPNGISITRTGRVNAAGFVASSLGITDEDFRAGRRQFRGSGASAPVSNHGAITIGRGGYAALIGGGVTNSGTISVPMGRVGLGSGERATLDLSGDGFLQVAVPTRAKGRGALVEHAGTISADGGSVTLTAAAARDMARQAVNLSGVVEARAISGKNGRITLSGDEGAVRVAPDARLDASGLGGADGGRVRITGGRLDVAGNVDVSGGAGGRVRLRASEHLALSGQVRAEGRAGKGGRVVATAPVIATNAALIDASGATGGGVVRVGGGHLGQGPLARAERVSVDTGSTIRADATVRGQGGDVVVWSDVATRFAGTITARGGAQGGNGGEAEVSSKGVLAYDGTTILTAAKGRFGTLLLDPHDITISTGADTNQSGFTATGNGSVINAGTLLSALSTANVIVSTGPTGNQSGTVTVAAPLSWNTSADLTLQAAGGIALNAPITARAGGLVLQAGSTVTATADLSVARFTLSSGDWTQNAATLPGFAAGDFRIAGGASFLRAAGGTGTAASPYILKDVYGLQGIGTSAAYRAASYRLADDVDAAGTATWWGGQGFVPIGTDVARFTGGLDGAGHTVSGLRIARPSMDRVGLIGSNSGTVANIGLTDGSVGGYDAVGGLVGYNNNGGTVTNAYATGAVSGHVAVGGLVGVNNGTVSRAYATGAVTGSDMYVGGLVGVNNGTVSNAYATGAVTGSDMFVGGLVGQNDVGTVSNAYASGSVTGQAGVGGLVGLNSNGTVSDTYASGTVTVTGGGFAGGLVGLNYGRLTNAYWDTGITRLGATGGGYGSATGTRGLTTAQARTAGAYASFDFANVWYQAGDLRPMLRSEAASPVGGVIPVSNLRQLQLMGANLGASYRLTRDLDASATSATDAASGIWGAGGFVPVGSGAPFTGSLDGAAHTITGLTIVRPTQTGVGLVGTLVTGGSIANLGLRGGSVTGFSSVGGLVGRNDGTVSNAYATGAVSGRDSVGGLVGRNSNGSITQAYATGAVSGGNSVGGLVGRNGNGSITQAYATGSVSGGDNVGGLVGSNDSGGRISQAYSTGAVSGSGSFVGGLIGLNDGGTLTATYWDKDTTGRSVGVGLGGAGGATSLTTAQARSQAGYTNAGDTTQSFDFATVWYQAGDLRPILRAQAAAAGADGVIPVSDLYQLQLMGANLSGRYRLTRDLDASATTATAAASGPWGAGGFVPVGTDANRFTGSLDGAGRTITGLTIARSGQDNVGLIGVLGGGVSGLGLVGGSVIGSSRVGGLVGNNFGQVSQSYASGSVTGSSVVGGLVGVNVGQVSQSYASGSVTGGASSFFVGGLVGYNFGQVSQSYASGSVTGSSGVGGLVGYNIGTVSQSYASGSVTGSSDVGGLVGYNLGTLTSTYWDTDATGQSGGSSSLGATGLTTAQMQDLSSYATTFAGFDFATVWAPPNRAGQGGQSAAFYPQLYSLSNVVAVTPNASRVYGTAGPIAAYAGLRPGDFVTTLGTLSTGATRTSDVGNYAVTASGTAVTSPAGNAYRILYVPGTLRITPATITVAGATGVDKTYDRSAALPAGGTGFTSSGVLFGDAVTVSAGSAAYDSRAAGARAVLVSGLSLSGAKAGNYVLSATAVTGSGTIARADLAVSGLTAGGKTYDGGTNATLRGTASVTAFGSDSVRLGGAGTGTFANKNAGAGKAVTVTGYTLGGPDGGNYTLVQPTGLTADITPATLTYTADRVVRSYGAANPTLIGTVSGFVSGESEANATTGTRAFGTVATASSNAGAYAITGGGLTANDGNYSFVQAAGNAGALTVDPALLSVAGTRTYDATTGFATGQLRVTGARNGEAVMLTQGSGTTLSADAGTYAGSALNLAIEVSGGNALASNYRLPATGDLSITPTLVSVTANGGRSTYGDGPINPGLSATGLQGGQDASVLTGLSNGFGIDATTGVGRYGLAVVGTLSNGNYTLAARTDGAWQVDPRPLTLTANVQTRVYGDANPALTYTVSGRGLVNGDGLTGGLITTADATSRVGSYVIDQGTLAASANYMVTYAGNTLTVGQRAVTVTANAESRAHGDANPGLTYRTTSLGAGAALSGVPVTGATASSNVGTYDITQGTLTPAANPNYAITYIPGTLTVGQRAVTVTADAQNRDYGDANPALTYRITSLGQGAALSGGLITMATASSDVGRYAISQGSLTAAANPNYALTYQGADLSVTARPLTIMAEAQTRLYGDADPSLTYRIGGRGLVIGDSLTGALVTTAAAGSGVGTYAIGQGTLAASANYVLTYHGADLTVTPRPVTLSGTRVYDAGTGIAGGLLTVANRRDGDSVTLTGLGTLAAQDVGTRAITGFSGLGLSDPNYTLTGAGGSVTITPATLTVTGAAGIDKTYDGTVALPAGRRLVDLAGFLGTDAERVGLDLTASDYDRADAGTRSIAVSGLALTGAEAGNYRLATTSASATGFIGQRAVTVTANGGSAVYGDTPANPGLSADGLASGEGVGVLTGLSNSFGLDARSAAGTYRLTVAGTLGNGNYRIAGTQDGRFTLDRRPVTVTPDALARIYGEANPATGAARGDGFVNGDGLTHVGLRAAADARSGVGRYDLTAFDAVGTGLDNYTITYAPQTGGLKVTPRPVTLSGTRVYDAGTGIAGGLLTVENRVNGDAVTISGTGTLMGRDVGTQALTALSGLRLSDANYTLIGAGGAVAITPATLTYEADAARRTYGATNPALTGTVTGFLGSDTLATAASGTLTFATDAGTGSNVGAYAVTGAGLSAGNYVLVQAAGNVGALTVDPALLTVTGTRTYDATTGFRAGQLAVGGGVNGETVTLIAGSGTTASADAGTYGGSSLTGLSLAVSGGNDSAANYRLPTIGTLAITPATVDVHVNDGRSVYGDRPVDPGLSATGLVGGQDAGVLTGLSTGFGLDAASAAGRTTLALTGRLANGNYRIGSVTAGTYTVDRRPITVTADTLGRVYGDADPTLTYTIGGRGLANGDRLTGALATVAGRRSDVGGYAIGQGTLAASANYALTYQGADLSVTARPITVFADPQARFVGATDPLLTYTVGGRGLVAGDRPSGGLATTAETESEPGLYHITRGSLTASANYSLGFVGADLTVLPAPPRPEPLPVALDASRLASTAERATRLDGRPAAPDLPLLLGTGPGGTLVAADPRFDATLVCTGHQGGCFLKPLPVAPMAAPVPAPTPQASAR